MERRIIVSSYLVLFVFALLVLKLFNLQVIRGEEYKKVSDNNRLKIVRRPAPRGIIYDRNGMAFVSDMPFFDASAVKKDLPEDWNTLFSLSSILNISTETLKAILNKPPVDNSDSVKFKENLSFDEVAMLEARKIEFPGLQVDVRTGRKYLYGALAGHVLGYLNRLTPGQLKNDDYSDVPQEAFVGQYGAEKFYDDLLRGVAGGEIIEVDAMGREIRVVSFEPSIRGKNIKLTIDMMAQLEAERSLAGKTGAVVAVDPQTGEILALASSPSFDPNLFSGGISHDEWNSLADNPDKPLLNRAIQSRYPPASTFKVITAIAALEQGMITEDTTFDCRGSLKIGGRDVGCWQKHGHGRIGLHRALAESCDVYFYEIGKRININTLADYAQRFGLGKLSGIDINGEITGLVPTSEWKERVKHEKWYMGETVSASIGQGYLTATPLQMAMLTAAVVNGGRLIKPSILMRDAGDSTLNEESVRVRPETLDIIMRGMRGAVQERSGTGWSANSKLTSIGGKTGTAQVVGKESFSKGYNKKFKDHAWFISFAPVHNAEIAVAVFVENGGFGGVAAAPIAKNVIEAYIKSKTENEKLRLEKLKEMTEKSMLEIVNEASGTESLELGSGD